MTGSAATATSEASNLSDVDGLFRRGAVPFAVVDGGTNRLIAVNRAFAELLHLDASQVPGLDLLAFVPDDQRPAFECVLSGVASGLIDSCHGRGRWRLPNGDDVDLLTWVRPLDSGRLTGRALLAAVQTGGAALPEPTTVAPESTRVALGAVDHDWKFSDIGPDAVALLGSSPEELHGTSLQSVVHPGDVPLLLLALGRSSADKRGIATRLRVRRYDDWESVRCTVTPLCEHNPPRFAFAMWTEPSSDEAEAASERASRLEDHLWRIAFEVQVAGVGDLPKMGEVQWADPALRELSQRQREILRRLLRGQRVPAIARELFLSESTVRNHLSAIYRRFGVHSQQELLARLRPAGVATPADRSPP